MIGDKRPLSVAALQGFLETFEEELNKTILQRITKDDILQALFRHSFPREPEWSRDGEWEGPWTKNKMPHNLAELRALAPILKKAAVGDRISDEIVQRQVQQAFESAVKVAENSMSGAATLGR